MNRNYLKNLYLQQIECDHYLSVFRESVLKVVSVELTNRVIGLAVGDTDETVLNDLLALFLLHLEANAAFHEKLRRADFHLFLFRRPLTPQSYAKLRCIYDRIDTRKLALTLEHTDFFNRHFYNYYLYKCAYNNTQFDLELDVRALGPAETALFQDLLRRICIENRENELLIEYVRGLPIDTDLLLAILSPAHRIDAEKISREDAFLIHPEQVVGCKSLLFYKVFLCSMNAENGMCRVCGSRVVGDGLGGMDFSMHLEDTLGDISELCLAASHWDVFRTPKTLTTLLKLMFQGTAGPEHFRCLRFFAFEEKSELEEVVVRTLKFVANACAVESLRTALRMFPFVQHTPRIAFSYFAVMYEGFLRHSDAFIRDLIRNITLRNRHRFMEIREMIFEFCLTDVDRENECNRERGDAVLEDVFAPLAAFFGEDTKTFVESNMFYIYPLMYPLPEFSHYVLDAAFVQANSHFLMIALFLKGEESKIDEMGYSRSELNAVGADVIVALFCNGYFRYDVLARFFGDVRKYIGANLSKVLFLLKTMHTERVFEFRTCVFKVLRHILEAVAGDAGVLFNYIFPFVEFFMGRHNGRCSADCRNVFIEYCVSLFGSGCLAKNMARIFPYLDVDRIVEWSGGDCLATADMLLDARGFFVQGVALEKAEEIFRRMFGDVFDEERFIRSLLDRFFRDAEFRAGVAGVYRKFLAAGSDAVLLIGCLSREYLDADSLACDAGVPVVSCTADAIARTMLRRYLFEIDPKKQDLHFFVIQETLRFVQGPLDESLEGVAEQFRTTRYSYEHVPVHGRRKVYERTYKLEWFLEGLYQHLLEQLRRGDATELFGLLKYGELFDTSFLEFNCLCLAKILLEQGSRDVLDIVEDVVGDLHRGLDRKIPRFVLKLHRFTERRHVSDMHILRISFFLGDHYTSIQALEMMIRRGRERKLFDVLQFCYYAIRDCDRVIGINSVFMRPTSVNLFFEFCVDRDYAAARRCLESRRIRECDDHAIHSTCTQAAVRGEMQMESSDGEGEIVPGVDLNLLLRGVLEECEDGEVVRFMDECRRIGEDFSEWKSLRSENEVFRHFLKDCELVSMSRDLMGTLDLIAGRRELAGNCRVLLECHGHLVAGIKRMMGREELSCDAIDTLLERESDGCFEELASVDMDVRAVRERTEYSERGAGEAGRYGSADEFERDVRLMMIRNHRREGEFGRCSREIGSMLLKKDWSVLHELAELNVQQGRTSSAKNALKKVLGLFPKTSVFYKRALVRHTELVDTKSAYQAALGSLNSSSRLFLLGAKKFEDSEALRAMELYISSAMHGSEHLDEAVPRIFHLFSEMCSAKDVKGACVLLKGFLDSNLNALVPYYNQIVSKMSHSNGEIAAGISDAVFRLMESHPGDTFWRSLNTINSQTADTRRRMEEITARLSFDNKVMLSNTKKIAEQLTEISQSKKKTLSMSADFPGFAKMLPINATIPNTRTAISSVGDEIRVFESLQSPKRMFFVGTDGKRYYWLCKYQDDLRKDSRFMDLNTIINNMLRRQNSRMHIRTYAVIPFNHCCGIIEWIDGLSSLKVICNTYYSREGVSVSETGRRFCSKKKIGPVEWPRVVEKFPPRFYLWFYDNFPEPFNWFTARNNYTTTYAVMNIVGWFMGLGDRHAENILFDSNTGDTVHVDLNCIFGKGQELEVPERVPYRLTQNVVDAFGVLGLEGLYNRSLYATLDLFLKNRNVLVSNLLSFVYDPLFEWKRKNPATPKKIIDELYAKLDDLDASTKGDMLNEEAASDDNLCRMYIGWLPFV